MLRQATSCNLVSLLSRTSYSQQRPATSFLLLLCRHNHNLASFPSWQRRRQFGTETTILDATTKSAAPNASESPCPSPAREDTDIYHGPLAPTFRRLKIFSLSSLALSVTLAPFMFLIESNLPTAARVALATTAITTSGISTALVSWCGKPYVTTLRRLKPAENDGLEGLEMMTRTLGLHPLVTRVYDPEFLVETKRLFAQWELAQMIEVPAPGVGAEGRSVVPGREETVAETIDKDGGVIGRWVVTWGEDGRGSCREVGKIVRYFNVHEELLH